MQSPGFDLLDEPTRQQLVTFGQWALAGPNAGLIAYRLLPWLLSRARERVPKPTLERWVSMRQRDKIVASMVWSPQWERIHAAVLSALVAIVSSLLLSIATGQRVSLLLAPFVSFAVSQLLHASQLSDLPKDKESP